MKFQNLKKNDIIFCETQNSRVIRLGNLINENSWLGRDVFSKQEMIVTNQDKFKLVNETRKPNTIKMSRLLESNSDTNTLTEKEVFIVNFFIDELGHDEISNLVESHREGNPDIKIPNILELRNYLNISNYSNIEDGMFIQYLICANDNIGNEINTNTKIKRVKKYTLNTTEISNVTRYDYIYYNFFAEDDETARKIQSSIKDNPFRYNYEYSDADYGDSDHDGFTDWSLEETGHISKDFVIR